MKIFLRYLYFVSILLFASSYATGSTQVLEVEIIIKDHKFQPEIIEIPANRKIRLTIHNQDNSIEEFDSFDLKREKIIPANSFVHIILAPLRPGKYFFIGEFHQDTAKGCIIVTNTIN